MLLAIDIGNTQTVVGVYHGPTLVEHLRLESSRARTTDEYGALLTMLLTQRGLAIPEIHNAILASVVPPLTDTFVRLVEKFLGQTALVVGPGIKTHMPVLYENPREVGADRIVNAVAAFHRVRAAAIVVDFGTATTFDAISKRGEYMGGAIAPGIGISAEALFARASKLPRVELVRPRHVVGRNTVASMQSGLVFGYVGLVEGIVARMRAEMAAQGSPVERVIGTGGLAPLIADETQAIDEVDEHLTLEGLHLIFELNRPQDKPDKPDVAEHRDGAAG